MSARWLALLGLAGCVAPVEVWHGDESFSEEERTQIERGYDFIAPRVGSHRLEIVWDALHLPDEQLCPFATICKRDSIVDFPSCAGKAGCNPPNAIEMAPSYAPTSEALSCLTAHELAHWKGYKHHDGPGLMNPVVPNTLIWTELDARSH